MLLWYAQEMSWITNAFRGRDDEETSGGDSSVLHHSRIILWAFQGVQGPCKYIFALKIFLCCKLLLTCTFLYRHISFLKKLRMFSTYYLHFQDIVSM